MATLYSPQIALQSVCFSHSLEETYALSFGVVAEMLSTDRCFTGTERLKKLNSEHPKTLLLTFYN